MKFGIIRERKNPPDRRVVLSPEECQNVLSKFPKAQIFVESSPIRVFSDKEYADNGLEVVQDMESCEVLLGVKEVPIDALIPNKKNISSFRIPSKSSPTIENCSERFWRRTSNYTTTKS